MWYSNNEPTPTKFRPRTYAISCDNDVTQNEFDLQYKWPIRSINSQWPECKFFIMALTEADTRVEEYLRELGVSPARITIFCIDYRKPENKYKSEIKMYNDRAILENEFVLYSSHDIFWVQQPEGMTARIKQKRAAKEKKQPWVDMMPDC